MKKVNRGKQFEECVKNGILKLSSVSIDRIPDQMTGYSGGSNICDFLVYRYPFLTYLECKCCYGNTLNFHNITTNQWEGMLSKSKIRGVYAGVLIWFIDWDTTVYVPIQQLQAMKEQGLKSVNIKSSDGLMVIPAVKKRVLFDYDFSNVF